MIRGFYTARSGLQAQQANMDVIANNLANVNTAGYKPVKVSFTDLMYQNLNRQTAENEARVGHGVKVNKTDFVMTPGAFAPTNYTLDFAIEAPGGFFAVMTDAEEIQYTRAGSFVMSESDGTFYLATPNGDRVLDADGTEIELEFDDENNLEFDFSTIGVYSFANPYGLTAVGNNRFVESTISGEAAAMEEPGIKQGYLEGSGTEVAMEMTKVIEASKAFSFNSRMVQVADEVEQTINQLR